VSSLVTATLPWRFIQFLIGASEVLRWADHDLFVAALNSSVMVSVVFNQSVQLFAELIGFALQALFLADGTFFPDELFLLPYAPPRIGESGRILKTQSDKNVLAILPGEWA